MWEGRGRGGALRNYGGSGVVEKGKGCGRRRKSRTWRIPFLRPNNGNGNGRDGNQWKTGENKS